MQRLSMLMVFILAMVVIAELPCQGAENLIYGCYQKRNGNLRIVNDLSKCKKSEIPISWYQSGPQGPQGLKGDKGDRGDQGPQGPPGADAILITSLPYAITTEGIYYLTKNLTTNITTGNAISINADNVIIDLNGYSISGEGTGPGTLAKGIYADQRKSVTIRNGTVKGFYFGIFLDDTSSPSFATSQKHIVEDVRADGNYHTGIYVVGSGNIVRNNKVAGIGGTTVDTGPWAHGIFAAGPGPRVLNNDVNDVNAGGIGLGMGIYIIHATNGFIQNNRVSDIYSPSGNAYGIYIQTSDSSVVTNNVIANPDLNGNSYGIVFDVGDDHIASDNRITKMKYGIYFLGVTTGTYMNNLIRGSTTPYFGGTPAGSTNY